MGAPSLARSLWRRAHAPIDAAGLAAFRILFGVIAFAIPIRFLANGWVERFYVQPTFFFSYYGFEWVRPIPAPWIHVVFGAMAIAGALIAVGLFYRAAVITFFVLFTYVELIDVTTYLNHYYLVSLLSFLMIFLPLHRVWSIDARRDPNVAKDGTIPAWTAWLLRFQVSAVYFFAALGKLTSDWMLHAQPLSIWLGARMDTPIIGGYFDRLEVAYLMSWAGFAFDLTVPLWLSLRRARPFAYAVLLGFHIATGLLFDIGMFPIIMTIAALVFFAPDWPRKIARAIGLRAPEPEPRSSEAPQFGGARAFAAAALLCWCAFHVLMPLRAHAYGRNVLWDEQGMRWSWRVLCREKTASVTYRVRTRAWGGEREIPPRRFLTLDQEIELAGQPDLILQLAHHIRDTYRARGEEDVEVRVDARASLNGRRSAPLIDPHVDLARVDDSLRDAAWILPEPDAPPARLTPVSIARGPQ
jgi:vitamin K-dependent gamma-carboxylase